jgi:hypothetical protein
MMKTPLKAIILKCLDCGGRPKEVKDCPVHDCPLYSYRFGKNPNRAGVGGRPDLVFKKSQLELEKI